MSHAVMRPTFERRDDRGWMVELLNRGPWETVLWGEMKAGEGVHFPVMQTHAIRFQGESEFLMLKSEPYDAKDPDTISYPVPE